MDVPFDLNVNDRVSQDAVKEVDEAVRDVSERKLSLYRAIGIRFCVHHQFSDASLNVNDPHPSSRSTQAAGRSGVMSATPILARAASSRDWSPCT